MGFLQLFLGSFYSVPMYRKLRTEKGNGLGYSILLILLTTFIGFMIYLPDMNRVHRALFVGENGRLSAFDDALRQIAAQTPTMTFQNYTLKTQEPGVHIIHLAVDVMGEHAEGDAIAIDTTGQTTYSNMKTPFLFTAHEMIVQTDKETKVRPYTELQKDGGIKEVVLIDRAKAKELTQEFAKWMHENLSMLYLIIGGFTLLVWIGIFYVMRIIMVMLVALGGMLSGNIMRISVPFENAMLIAAVSYTPVAVLDLLLPKITGGPGPGPLALLLCGVIMFTAVLLVTREPKAAA